LLAFLGLTEKNVDVLVAVDKLKKVGSADVQKELKQKGLSPQQVEQLFSLLTLPGKNRAKIAILREKITNETAQEGLREIEELLSYVDRLGDESNVSFEPTLARGLAYYTGPVFEAFLKKTEEGDITSSLVGGGRYDAMIGKFLGSGEFPAVGISFGIEPIVEQLKISRAANKDAAKKTVTKVFLIPIQTINQSLSILGTLRKEGVNADIDLIGRGISKNLDYANALGIPYVLIVGPKEIEQNKVKLKDMVSGTEEMMSVGEVCTRMKG